MDERVFGGKYTTARRLGSGGVAETWEATDSTGHTVVVKSFAGLAPEQTSWLEASAKAAADVSSPWAARVLDWGAEGADGFYLVREFVAGTDLASMIAASGPLASSQVAAYGAEIAGALAALHAHGVVHGNVKPANVLLTPDGQIKVVGVGMPPIRATVTRDTPSTATMYTSPEQLEGGAAVFESDVYGAGATLFTLATGGHPYEGENAEEVARNVISATPAAAAQLNPSISPALSATIARAMHKQPVERQGSAAELQQELEQEAGATQIMPPVPIAAPIATAAQPEKKKRPVWPWVVGGIVLLALIALGTWYALAQQAQRAQQANMTTVPTLQGMTKADAATALVTAQLQLGKVGNTQTVQEGVPAGVVVGQSPAAGGKVAKGSKVGITLNGPTQAPVPSEVGQTEAQAIEALQTAGFTAGPSTQAFSSKFPAGIVISQSPVAGTQSTPGSVVTLTVSKGIKQGTVPDVTGTSQTAATRTLQAAGFGVSVRTASSTSVDEGQVMSQSPAGGVTAVAGTTVVITISTGAPHVSVPNVHGESSTSAANILGNAGLKVTTEGSSASTATVQSQDPSAGTSVARGSTVTITMGP